MEIAALQENKIIDRFCSVNEMARWLTSLLGWPVDAHYLRNAIERFNCRNNSKPDPEKYLIFVQLYAEEHIQYLETKRKMMEKLLLVSKSLKKP